MAAPQYSETNLIGYLQAGITAAAASCTVKFYDKVTGLARIPVASTLLFVIDKGSPTQPNPNYEIILATSHSTTSGVTTITIAARGLAFTGTSLAAGTGKSHVANAEIGCADVHFYTNILASIADGTTPAVGNLDLGNFKIVNLGTPTAATDAANKSYIDGVAIAGAPDSSTTVKGITKMSVAPASATSPIAVGDNDTRVPTALVATSAGATDSAKVPKLNGSGQLDTSFLGTANTVPTGAVFQWATNTAPAAYLLCDGTAVSRSTYATLFTTINVSKGAFTVTLASPGVFSLTSHGLLEGDTVYFTTTGALPTGLSANTLYYVISAGLTANAFEVSATRGGAAVNTSGSQSGVHTLLHCPFGLGDGSTTFNVPNIKGKIPYGRDSSDANFATLNVATTYTGEKTHILTTAEMPAHTHTTTTGSGTAGASDIVRTFVSTDPNTTSVSGSAGGGGAHNNLPPYLVMNYIIKT